MDLKQCRHAVIEIIGKACKLPLPISILVASIILGSFYYASESAKQKRLEEQQWDKEERSSLLLNNCLGLAREAAIEQRYVMCEGLGLLKGPCRQIKEIPLEEFTKEKGLSEMAVTMKWADSLVAVLAQKERCGCLLPASISDKINERFKDRKNECYQGHPPK